jgi:signal transduction histidine kinase
MTAPLDRVQAPSDPKARMVSIFVGAVLLPSVALSVLSFNSVPKHAENLKSGLLRQAQKVLYYVEKDLEIAARSHALEAARVVGTDRLLEGRPEEIQKALVRGGIGKGVFASLRLEASSPISGLSEVLETRRRDMDILRDAFSLVTPPIGPGEEDSLPLTGSDSRMIGVLRFRYTCEYAHEKLVRDFFENEFSNPDNAWVIRVSEPEGKVLYENAATPDGRPFEVKRVLESPSFRGLKLFLRYRDRSIEEDVRRWAMGKTALIGFIDLMLGAGLFLVYSNVRREMHLSRLKSDFVANVSHELKTPLALIRLFAETLELQRVPTEEKKRQYYRVIHKESQRLTQLINNILDFSRIEAGGKGYRFAPEDLNRIVSEVLEAYRFPIEQQGFVLERELAEDLPVVDVDKEALSQAILNLLNNAIKYSRDEKRLRVETAKGAGAGTVRLSVTDHGIGISAVDHRKIFEKFYRAENSLVHETKGSGLGLSLVRHIVEAHGGEVLVESSPGKGSTFTIVLPIRQEGAPPQERAGSRS